MSDQQIVLQGLIAEIEQEIQDKQTLLPVLREILAGLPDDPSPDPPPEPPPDPAPQNDTYKIKAYPYLNIRVEPTLNSPDVGDLYPGTLVEVEELRKVGDNLWGKVPDQGWIALALGDTILAEKVT
jgi:hypothetical protein